MLRGAFAHAVLAHAVHIKKDGQGVVHPTIRNKFYWVHQKLAGNIMMPLDTY